MKKRATDIVRGDRVQSLTGGAEVVHHEPLDIEWNGCVCVQLRDIKTGKMRLVYWKKQTLIHMTPDEGESDEDV